MPRRPPEPNHQFRAARERLRSPDHPDHTLTREELADAVNQWLADKPDPDGPVTANHVGMIEQGRTTWPRAWRRHAYRAVLGAGTDTELGFTNRRRRVGSAVHDVNGPVHAYPGVEVRRRDGGIRVQRRDALLVAAASLSTARLAAGPAAAIMAIFTSSNDDLPVSPLPDLANTVKVLKESYQAGRYAEVVSALPRAVGDIQGQRIARPSAALSRLAADIYQVAGGVALKFGDTSSAFIASDRSLTAARQSESPLALASSARLLTHCLTADGYHHQAALVADRAAAAIPGSPANDPAVLSLYGALLLRGAVAAGRAEDHDTAHAFLDQADGAARRLGVDGNWQWTAFGPTNVAVHRVHLSVLLGDAGTAIRLASTIDATTIALAERRACLFIDVATAYAMWDKHDPALELLEAAVRVAPQETARPYVRRIVARITAASTGSSRRRSQRLTRRLQAAAA